MRSWFAGMTARRDAVDEPQSVAMDGPVAATPETIRAALAEILSDSRFDATMRSRRFLAYIVEETLAGRADRIKAFSIATDVFGRGANFDAHADPIVRVEAGRLRRGLEQYYQGPGREAPIVLAIPKGAYVPQFLSRPPASASISAIASGPPPRRSGRLAVLAAGGLVVLLLGLAIWQPWRAGPSGPAVPRLLVRAFDDLSGSDTSAAVARGLRQEIIGQMAKFKDVVTVEGGGRASEDEHSARYVLMGGVSLAENKLRLQARVLDAADASVLWAQSYDAAYDPAQLIATEAELARRVVTALGQPYGVIFKADSGRASAASNDWAAYSCTLSYYSYRANLDAKSHLKVRQCLEETVARFPGYATAWALLAQSYLDELRFQYPVVEGVAPASLERAMEAAKRAVELDPQNVRALQSKMLALYFDRQVEASLAIGERAMLTNPNDTELIGEYGVRLADSGQWKRGCALIAETLDRNPGPLGYYEAVLSVCAYIDRDYDTATMWIRRAAVMDNPAYHLIAAAVFAEAGQAAEAESERVWLMAHAPKFVANVRDWAGVRNVPPADRDRFFASLRRAGLDVPPS